MNRYSAVHIWIEGIRFDSIYQLRSALRSKGFKCAWQTVSNRLKAGATTFAELMKPIPPHGGGGQKAKAIKNRAEMHALCQELDARKKALKESL